MKKIIEKLLRKGVIAALVLALSVANAQELSFSNELGTGVIDVNSIRDDGSGEKYKVKFGGITNETKADFTSEKVDVGAKVKLGINTEKNGKSRVKFSLLDLNYYINFRPHEIVTLGFSSSFWIEGSYLPIWDDNVSKSGNLGTGNDGFSVIITPIDGLRLGATCDFNDNVLGKTFWAGEKKFDLGIGADYSFNDKFSIGAKFGGFFEDFYFGAFVAITPVDMVGIRAGFSLFTGNQTTLGGLDFFDICNINGKAILNAAVDLHFDIFNLFLETVIDFSSDDGPIQSTYNPYDMYLAACFGFWFDKFDFDLTGKFMLDFADKDSGRYRAGFGVEPKFIFKFNENHSLKLACDIEFYGMPTGKDSNGDWQYDTAFCLKIPCSWTYKF